MYLRAGLVSLGLLLLSRVLGLVRESAQAAAFGSTALADVAVTLMTLPDLASGILAGGALSYVLLPWWAHQTQPVLAASQRKIARAGLAVGGVLALWIAAMPGLWGRWLAPGTGGAAQSLLAAGLRWSALAIPLSLLAMVWSTRAQHERDFIGMYGPNAIHNGVLILAITGVGGLCTDAPAWAVAMLGLGLLLALGLRLAFVGWRLGRADALAPPALAAPIPAQASGPALPAPSVWLWAVLVVGLPVAMTLVARSLASQSAPGALASFNYAWKLVEIPNQLAIQLVASLSFPVLARAQAQGLPYQVPLRTALCLAWTLACAGATGLHLAADPLAQLLFGWGRMDGVQVAQVAVWARAGAWSLLPQALIAVTLLVLAVRQRLAWAAALYALGLLGLLGSGLHDGLSVMGWLVALQALLALGLLVLAGSVAWRALDWRDLGLPLALSAAALWGAGGLGRLGLVPGLGVGALGALFIVAASYAVNPVLRVALKR